MCVDINIDTYIHMNIHRCICIYINSYLYLYIYIYIYINMCILCLKYIYIFIYMIYVWIPFSLFFSLCHASCHWQRAFLEMPLGPCRTVDSVGTWILRWRATTCFQRLLRRCRALCIHIKRSHQRVVAWCVGHLLAPLLCRPAIGPSLQGSVHDSGCGSPDKPQAHTFTWPCSGRGCGRI